MRLLILIATTLVLATPAQAQRPDGATNNRPQSYRDRDDWRERPKPAPSASKSSKSLDGSAPLISVRPMPNGPPSPAEQMQRRMEEERRNQRGEQSAIAGNFQCNAYPVCDRSSGSYGSCRGVEQLYSAKSRRDARQQAARDCAAVNTPDPCNCAAQCSRVAQCGPI